MQWNFQFEELQTGGKNLIEFDVSPDIYCNDLLALKELFCCFDIPDRARQFVVATEVILWSGI